MNKRNISLLLLLSISIFCFAQSNQLHELKRGTSLKLEPDSDSRTILRLSKNDQVIHLGECNRYYCKVEFNDKIGWVKKSLLEKIASIEESNLQQQPTIKKEIQQEEPQQEESVNQPSSPVVQNKPLKEKESRWGYFIPWYSIILLTLMIGLIAYFLFKRYMAHHDLKKEYQNYQIKYQGIDDVNNEIALKRNQFKGTIYNYEANIKSLDNEQHKIKAAIKNLKLDYKKGQELYTDLVRQQDLLKEDLDIAEFGVYEPQFDFETSGVFKLKIQEIRAEQKELIKDDKAALGGRDWQVNGSAAKGRAMIKKQKKLMLRAFNGECDSLTKGVKWNNVKKIEERIIRSVDAINKMGESQSLTISTSYSTLKLIELKLTHEYNLKKYEEKEEQRRIREQIREEEKAKRDFEKALKDAEKEENILQKLMKQAQEKYAKASEAEKLIYQSKLSELEGKLKEAHEKNQRALSMAQQTKAGHVYVISNIGSFGENVFKIGMTRRLDPMDRVKELGDASVPFKFDVHAIIYSENAPELENKLHKHFDKYRLNHINRRREYFNVSLHEIKKVVNANYGEFEFVIEPEAKEYRESIVVKEQLFAKKQTVFAKTSFPEWNSIN